MIMRKQFKSKYNQELRDYLQHEKNRCCILIIKIAFKHETHK